MFHNSIFDREGSTLGVMDDLQVAIHSYDGCAKGCPGCVVDKHFKNNHRFKCILTDEQMDIAHSRVEEYYHWCVENLNTKDYGYFGKHEGGYQVNHFSYTFRFGNHSELPVEEIKNIARRMNAEYKVFSTAPTDDIYRFVEVAKEIKGRYFLEIIYDPVADDPHEVKAMIEEMRKNDILGYPEVLITRRLLSAFTPKRFVEEAIGPLGYIGTQMQFGRYSPSKTRGFRTTQVVPLDEEVEWLAEVTRLILDAKMNLHPIPIGEYAVTLLDEYGEHVAYGHNGYINEDLLPPEEEFNIFNIKEKTRDIFLSSLYIDHNLDLYVWSESMGQHVLDVNFGYEAIGNIREHSIAELVTQKGGTIDKMLNEVVRNLLTHKKCRTCRYKSFCASHAIPLFRRWHDDDGKHCYGYIPVIREFQTDQAFLKNMIDGFKELDF